MATSLQTLQLHLQTCESQWQPLYRPYISTFLPVSLNGNLSTDLTAPPSYLWVSMATFLQSLRLHLPTCESTSLHTLHLLLPCESHESQWQPLYRPYCSTFLPVSLNLQPLYRPYGSTFLPVSLNGNLPTALMAPPSYLWVPMTTSLQALQLHLPTCESQWQLSYRAYNSTFLPVSLNGNFPTELITLPSYLWVSMATFLQSLQLLLPTCESQWQPSYSPYGSTFLPVSLNRNLPADLLCGLAHQSLVEHWHFRHNFLFRHTTEQKGPLFKQNSWARMLLNVVFYFLTKYVFFSQSGRPIFAYFLFMSQQALSGDIILNTSDGIFSPKTEGIKT